MHYNNFIVFVLYFLKRKVQDRAKIKAKFCLTTEFFRRPHFQ